MAEKNFLDKVYDKYEEKDWKYGTDNLNPIREVDLYSIKTEKDMVAAINAKMQQIINDSVKKTLTSRDGINRLELEEEEEDTSKGTGIFVTPKGKVVVASGSVSQLSPEFDASTVKKEAPPLPSGVSDEDKQEEALDENVKKIDDGKDKGAGKGGGTAGTGTGAGGAGAADGSGGAGAAGSETGADSEEALSQLPKEELDRKEKERQEANSKLAAEIAALVSEGTGGLPKSGTSAAKTDKPGAPVAESTSAGDGGGATYGGPGGDGSPVIPGDLPMAGMGNPMLSPKMNDLIRQAGGDPSGDGILFPLLQTGSFPVAVDPIQQDLLSLIIALPAFNVSPKDQGKGFDKNPSLDEPCILDCDDILNPAQARGDPTVPIPLAILGPIRVVPADQQLTVTWLEVKDAIQYEVWYKVTSDPESQQQSRSAGKTAKTTLVIKNLINGVQYTVWINARNGTGNGPFSKPEKGTPRGPVSAPTASFEITAEGSQGVR